MEVMEELRLSWATTTPLPRRLLAAVAGPGAVTLLAIPQQHPPTAVVAVLYVLAVVIAARVGGALGGVGASLLSFLSLNFFFTPPFHTFVVAAPEDLVALFVFLIVSVIVGLLLSSALSAKSRSQQRELEARLLNRLATRLLSGESTDQVLAGFAEGICELFDLAGCEISTTFTSSVDHTRVTPVESSQQVRLTARGRDIGEMRISIPPGRRLTEDEQIVIQSLATQLALALEGMRLSVQVRRAELDAQASELKAALFSGVTHDVKTPLAAIMTAVTSLMDGRGFSDAEHHAHLDTIKEEAERLHRVVNNLLDVARLRAGVLVPKKTPSAIDELIESVISRLRQLLDGRPVEMRVGEDVPEVPMDVVQIDQVLTNLFENAVKFTPSGSPVSILAVGNSQGVRVTVSDHGPGIPKKDRVRIFEPFERAEASETGTGLGLAISNAIVVAHGGRMWVSDNPTGGAAFTFELPCETETSREEVSDFTTGAGR
jgi:two-component system sensor histidine kinase KdpD